MGINDTEEGFEENIEKNLMESGYIERQLTDQALADFQAHAIDVEMLFQFLEATQPKQVERLKNIHGVHFQRNVLDRIEKRMDSRRINECLRHGVKGRGVKLRLVINKPTSSLNKLPSEQ